ncbi:FecR domain-containing protein [Paraflavisolibacter sp. H34]|uniref:FecR family protein n=1 Tax=Huijunlia imazamoxiresistens TaxID=3127457 RepID=UPI0030175237
MNQEEIILFLKKMSNGTATEGEKAAFYRSLDLLDENAYQHLLLTYQELIQKREYPESAALHVKRRLEESLDGWEEQDEPKIIRRWNRSRWATVAAAASVLLVIALGWLFFFQKEPEAPVVLRPGNTVDRTVAVIRHERNSSGKEKRIQLPDGSLVVLANASEISYQDPFYEKRDITLSGKAYFKVAKDKARPFTVLSKQITTTALGTEFTVTAFKQENRIIVRLYEGKVVVRAVNKGDRKLKKEVYLAPGQELVYGGASAAKAQDFKLQKADAPEQIMNGELSRDNPSLPEDAEGYWFMFNNQALGSVFGELEKLYNVRINYNDSDVQHIYVTGKFNRSDSLEYILKQISLLHNLTVTRNSNAYTVSK